MLVLLGGHYFFFCGAFKFSFWNIFILWEFLYSQKNQNIFIFLINNWLLFPCWGFPGGSDSKESAWKAGDPGSERSSGEGCGNPLQYFCLENSMDRRASPWGHKESDMTEQLTHTFPYTWWSLKVIYIFFSPPMFLSIFAWRSFLLHEDLPSCFQDAVWLLFKYLIINIFLFTEVVFAFEVS